jgi:hypothetical protein
VTGSSGDGVARDRGYPGGRGPRKLVLCFCLRGSEAPTMEDHREREKGGGREDPFRSLEPAVCHDLQETKGIIGRSAKPCKNPCH